MTGPVSLDGPLGTPTDWGRTSPVVSGLPAGWRDQLNRQAQAIAAEAERAVFDHTQQFKPVEVRPWMPMVPDNGGSSSTGGRPVRPSMRRRAGPRGGRG